MDDNSAVSGKQLQTAKRPKHPLSKSPLTENQQDKENDNVSNADAGVENEDTLLGIHQTCRGMNLSIWLISCK